MKFTTGVVRLSYANLTTPKENDDPTKKPRYETGLLIDKDDDATLATIQKMIDAALVLGKATKWDGKVPKGAAFKLPLHDGDTDKSDDDPAYQGKMFLTARSGKRPIVIDAGRNPIIDPDEVYSGMYAHVILEAYPFSHSSGSKGVGVGLVAVLKVRDGEPLGGSTTSLDAVVDMFAGVEVNQAPKPTTPSTVGTFDVPF